VPPWFKKINNNDQVTKKKTSTNLGTMGSANSGWDPCWMDGCAEEGDTGVITTTSKDIKFSNKIN
jgi:hypothetical protein